MIHNFIFLDNSQEESSNSSAAGDFVLLNSSIGKILMYFIVINNLSNLIYIIDNNLAKCEQCHLYKVRIQEMQDKINDADKRLQSMEKLKDEHDKETIYRKQMEEKWNEKLEEHKNKAFKIYY